MNDKSGSLKRLLLLLVSICSLGECLAQEHTSARSLAMGSAGAGTSDAGATLVNPGAIASINGTALYIGQEFRYDQPDLVRRTARLIFSLGAIRSALSGAQLSLGSVMKETAIGLTVGGQLQSGLRLAGTLHRHQLKIGQQLGETSVRLGVGVQYPWNYHLTLGLSLQNLSLSGTPEYFTAAFPLEARAGIFYESAPLGIAADLLYAHPDRLLWAIGLDYGFFADLLSARIGMQVGRSIRPHAGLGFRWKQFRADAGARFHHYLGISPQLDLTYAW